MENEKDVGWLKAEGKRTGCKSDAELAGKLRELKDAGCSSLGAMAFVQSNRGLTLAAARDYVFATNIWPNAVGMNEVMMSDFAE
ncbi:MAG: hypothetical protein LBS91_05815 [Clostridiales Family XIII bacterium]|jgi:hypothetical protein|nr:hypothetical protein [Clostridiales Family XIII bacterium]